MPLIKGDIGAVQSSGKPSEMRSIQPELTEPKRSETALHEREERQAFLLYLNDSLRALASPTEIKKTACTWLGEYLRTNRVHYFDIIGERFVAEGGYAEGVAPLTEGAVVNFGEVFLREFQDNELMVSDDVRVDSRFSERERAHVLGADIASFIVVMLVKDGRWVAAFAAHHKQPRHWTQTEVDLVRDVAERIREASQRARVEAALRESEDRCRAQSAELLAVLESMSDAVYIGNREGITIANQAALDQLGYSTREELNRNIATLSEEIQNRDLETGLRIPDEELPFMRALGGTQVVREVLVRHRLSGQDRILRSAASPIMLDGKLIGAVAVNTDITTEKRAQSALREAEKLAVVGRLASSIAHEINNPLEAVINLIYLAEGAALSPQTREYLQQAQTELARMSHIASETLRFHRQNKEAVAVDLSVILDSVVTLHEGRLHAAQITLNRYYRPHTPLICFANELRQMAANLIGNAIDAMIGYPRRILFLRVREAHDPLTNQKGVRLTVADTGIGMAPATKSRIFEPFFSTKEHTGTGLGLWITRSIVGKHKGKICVRSRTEAHSGTVFSIFLPSLRNANQTANPTV